MAARNDHTPHSPTPSPATPPLLDEILVYDCRVRPEPHERRFCLQWQRNFSSVVKVALVATHVGTGQAAATKYRQEKKKTVARNFSQQNLDLLPLLCKSGFTCGFHRVLGTLHFRKIASPAQANKSLVKPQHNGESFGLLQFYTHSVSLGLFAGTIHKTGWRNSKVSC